MLDHDATPYFFNPDINSCQGRGCVKPMVSSQPFEHMFTLSDTLKLSVTVVLHSIRLLFGTFLYRFLKPNTLHCKYVEKGY